MDFSKLVVKDYANWVVNVNPNQCYLGRCVVWCKREDALDSTDATSEEWRELLVIFKELRAAVSKVFQPDWFNYALLGNETRHLHAHFIPRYAKTREFMGVNFVDKFYGHNYVTDHGFTISEPVLMWIKKSLEEALKQ